MWLLGHWNEFSKTIDEMDCRETEEEVRETLQIWISDEYYNSNIESFSEEYYEDFGLTVITIDGEIYYIGEKKF